MKNYTIKGEKLHNCVGYFNDDYEYHRTNGPAFLNYGKEKEWWINGKQHREDGPAVERKDGHKEYWINDKLHRTDGPAVEYADGYKEWYLNDNQYTEEQYNEIINYPMLW